MTKASIIIITHNRPKYLRRILNYYNSCKTIYKLIVSDSSSEENKIMNKEITSLFPKLDILYVGHYLDKIDDFRHQAGDSLNYVKTKYCVFCADDDFITPNGVKQCVDFLEHNPDFTVAHGRYVCFYLKEKKCRKKQFCWRPGYSYESITFNKAENRLSKHFSDFSVGTLFAVHRSDFFKMVFKETLRFTNDERFAEFLPPMLALIYGKMKCLDIPYSAKEIILNSAGIRNENFQDFINDGSYNEKYARFKECLAIHLSKNSQLDIEKSKMLIDDAMIAYLKKYEANDFEHFLINIMKYILSFLPERAYEKIRSLYIRMRLSFLATFSKPKDNFLNSIEDPSSKYYNDFVKIRDCVMSHDQN
jgi:glycosyltransferase domain-containing protein